MQKAEIKSELAIEDLGAEEFTVEALEERFEMQALGASSDLVKCTCIIEW